ncbi:hypothetical protein [Novipirellula artificiosorum]|uniref:Uncharacterized protein n=1 Tax=Novipirellula artificiosorum TaxID=2528016 RepID=A0A5C6CX28_9BACT|nr:hypothetical protein [Novipirellula artificiosorum]TWU29122.1 hypothetical protein Poly41_66940 [Novipirellula artificiosorum]
MIHKFRFRSGSDLASAKLLPIFLTLHLALLAVLISGCAASLRATCAPYEELKRRTVLRWAAERQANRIWKDCHQQRYQQRDGAAADAKHGFVTAYVETALGTADSPPPVPLRPLLSRHTIHHTYPCASDWYDGYNYGQAAALSRGVDRWRLAEIDPALMCSPCECSNSSLGVPIEYPIETDSMMDEHPVPEWLSSTEPTVSPQSDLAIEPAAIEPVVIEPQ